MKGWMRTKRTVVVVAAGVLALEALSGCSSHEEEAGALEEDMTEALEELEGAEEEAAEEEAEEEEELTASEALALQLDEDEQLMAADEGITEVALEGSLPEEEVTVPEDAVLWLIVPSGGISCAVYAGEGEIISGEEADPDGDGVPADTSLVWLDAGNEWDMKDPNSVIHGLGRSEGDGLLGMLNLGDETYWEENPYVYVYLDDAVREYRVFAAYTADTENILVKHNCYYQEYFYSYIDEIYEQRSMSALLNEDLKDTVKAIRRMLTIQVSIADGEDFIVQCVPTGVLAR